MGKIGNAAGVAGLMGNLYAESSLKSNNLQNSYNRRLNISDEDYTRLVDGIIILISSRIKQVMAWRSGHFGAGRSKSIGDLQMQLDFLWKEMNDSYPAVLVVLKGADKVRQASDAVLLWYERPVDQSEAVQAKRAGYGEKYLKKYGGGSVLSSSGISNADCPFLVKVTAKDLRIRKGAGTDTKWIGKYVPPGVYTIVEVKDGKGSEDGWRRLKSGAGWIALSYCKRV